MSPLLCTQGLGDRTMHRACAVATPGRGKTRGVVPVPSKYEISLTSRKCSPVVFAIKDTHCPKFPERKMLSLPFLFHSCLLVFCMRLCLTLCDPVDCSPPGSSVHCILQARILEWAAMPSSRGSFQPRDQTCRSCFAG